MKKLSLLFTFILSFGIQAQNLVPNPSFEIYTDPLPSTSINGMLNIATPWFRTVSAPDGGGYSSDYVHINMPLTLWNGDTYEFSLPNTGRAYGRFIICYFSHLSYYTESFQVHFEEPLQEGEIYQVSFYLQKGKRGYAEGPCVIGSDELAVYFHTDTIYQVAYSENFDDPYKLDNYLELWTPYINENGSYMHEFTEYLQEPRVELNELIDSEDEWVLVTDTIHANKAYEFMVFSKFSLQDDIVFGIPDESCVASSTYSIMHIDDVSVHLVNEEHIEADAGADATICNGDSIQIGTTAYEDYMYWWSPNEEIALDTFGYVNPGMPWVKPTVTTTYTLSQKDFAFLETTDEVTITVEYCPGFSVSETVAETIKIFPNPVKNFVKIESIYSISSWEISDAVGKEVASSKYVVPSRNLVLDVSNFDAGVYFLEMEVNEQLVIKQLLIE